jgi:hypothetical protein
MNQIGAAQPLLPALGLAVGGVGEVAQGCEYNSAGENQSTVHGVALSNVVV